MSVLAVTGASGYLASHLVAQLLLLGFHVHGTVRSVHNEERIAHLKKLEGADERLTLFEADLMTPGSFREAFTGCEAVFHTASPFFYGSQDPEKELVEPALQGTRNVLETCKELGIRRVVLTSSMVAIYDHPAKKNHTYTEEDWNTTATLENGQGYFVSKRLAEQAAWEFAEEHDLNLTSINPSLIMGPILSTQEKKISSTSVALLANLLEGKVNRLMTSLSIVDVRDVAHAHIQAFLHPEISTGKRFACTAFTYSIVDLIAHIQRIFPQCHHLPGASEFPADITLARIDNSRIQEELGVEFRDLDTILRDTFASLRDANLLPAVE